MYIVMQKNMDIGRDDFFLANLPSPIHPHTQWKEKQGKQTFWNARNKLKSQKFRMLRM